MDRTELKNILREESSSALKSLHPGFFQDVEKYVKELEEEIVNINNPRSVESKMLQDELQSAITDVELIFIRRLKKIVTRATNNAFSSKSPSQDMNKLLPEERKVYDAVLSAINTARKESLEPILDPQALINKAKHVKLGIDKNNIGAQQKENVQADLYEGDQQIGISHVDDRSSKEQIGKSNINKEFVVVRILEDLPTFKAMDNRNYTLHGEDVIVLPALNAKGLIKRNVAQMIL
ncbi:hypothetical protein [Methanolobus psychrotolerans]|uniref:hypothetical protein n=1 Tax=Methanolobus psychrotolerans TaxID=1874706 RepID=UPI000B919528|nr:hypothetical protein [Methanolobus psychrotolerans]